MKFTSTITEDSVTPYLDHIETRLHASRRELAYEIGKFFAKTGAENAPEWKGNLESSIDDMDDWILFDEGDFIKLDIIFTGLADEVDEWWWEFENPHLPEGGRDYALFQETGVDWYADPKYAKDKWYVKRSVEPTQEFAMKYLEKEIARIINTK